MANRKSDRRYVALTTLGGGFYVSLMGEPGQDKDAVEERAMRLICGDQWDKAKDIQTDTELKNLQVLSVSAARRAFPKAMRHYDEAVAYGDKSEWR